MAVPVTKHAVFPDREINVLSIRSIVGGASRRLPSMETFRSDAFPYPYPIVLDKPGHIDLRYKGF